jgi:hypothetical protein
MPATITKTPACKRPAFHIPAAAPLLSAALLLEKE